MTGSRGPSSFFSSRESRAALTPVPVTVPAAARTCRQSDRERQVCAPARTHARDPLIDPPRPAPPSCCHLPLLPHRYCHTALATWGTGPIVQHRQVLHPHHRTRRPRVDWLVREQTFGVDVRVFRIGIRLPSEKRGSRRGFFAKGLRGGARVCTSPNRCRPWQTGPYCRVL